MAEAFKERPIGSGRMLPETFVYRQQALATWLRALENKFPGDDQGQIAAVREECGFNRVTFDGYRSQGLRSDAELANGIPRQENLDFILEHSRSIIEELDLQKNGKVKHGRPDPKMSPASPGLFPEKPARSKAIRRRRRPTPIAAKRSDSGPSNIDITRALVSGMSPAELRVIFDHVYATMKK